MSKRRQQKARERREETPMRAADPSPMYPMNRLIDKIIHISIVGFRFGVLPYCALAQLEQLIASKIQQ